MREYPSNRCICDAEIGKPGQLHGCRRPAVVSIQSAFTELHYCERHRARASDRTERYHRRAPGAEPREIVT